MTQIGARRAAPTPRRRSAAFIAVAAAMLSGLSTMPEAAASLPSKPTCYREVGPAGLCDSQMDYLNPTTKAVVIVFAMSGWRSAPRQISGHPASVSKAFEGVHYYSRWLRDTSAGRTGIATMTVELTNRTVSGTGGYGPVAAQNAKGWFDWTRAYLDQNGYASLPLCLFGASAGGHMALLAGMDRPQADCIVTEGAPTDLQRIGSTGTQASADTAFAPIDRVTYSPSAKPNQLTRPTLMSHLTSDTMVSPHNLYYITNPTPPLTRVQMTSILNPGPDSTQYQRICGDYVHACDNDNIYGANPQKLNEWQAQARTLILNATRQ